MWILKPRSHVYAILVPTTSALLDTRSFPTSAAGITRAITWGARRTDADTDVLWVIDGAASCGMILSSVVARLAPLSLRLRA